MFKRVNTIFVLLIMSFSTNAQTSFSSLEDIWKYADVHNTTIRTARFELDKSVYSKRQSYSAMLPQVTANGSYTDNNQLQTTVIPANAFNPGASSDSIRTFQFGRQFVYVGGISAQVSVFNLQNWYNTRIAKQTEELNKAEFANNRKNIYQQIAAQYYSFLLMKEAARLSDKTALIADSIFQSISNKFKEGAVNEANVDIAKLNLERAQQNYIIAQFQILTARNNIKALLNIPLKDSLAIDGNLDAGFKTENYENFREDPAIKVARNQQKISLSQYKSSNAAFAPTVNLVYNYTTQRFDNTFEPFVRAKGVLVWFPSQYWALQASWPLFTSGNRWFQSRKNKIAFEESREQYENAVNQSSINDENTRLNYQKSLAVLNKSKEIMNLSFNNYRHISNRYQAGIAPLDDRLNAFKDYIDYQNQYLNSLSDMLVQLYQVKIRQQSF